MIDLKLDVTGDLELSAAGDISATDSIMQAVRIRISTERTGRASQRRSIAATAKICV